MSILIRVNGFSHSHVGILLAACESAAILSPFIFGGIADRLGRYRPVMIACFFTSFAAGLVLLFSGNPLVSAITLPLLAFGYRALQPLTDAVSTINLGKDGNYGKYRTVGSLVFFLIAFFLQCTPVMRPNTSFNISFWVCIAAFLGIAGMIIVPGHYFVNKNKQNPPKKQNPFQNPLPVQESSPTIKFGSARKLWTPLFTLGFIIIFLNRLAYAPIQNFISLYVSEDMHWDAVGLMWVLSSGAEMPFIFLSKHFIKRFGDLPLIVFSGFAIIIRLAICVFFPYKAGIIIAQCLHSFSYGLFHPAAVSFISRCVAPEHRALGMSLYLSLGTSVPILIASFAGGFIVDYSGYKTLFAVFSVFAFLSIALYFSTRRFLKE
jgi:PPP family 3-phenylpropionic acid transporter